MPLRVAQAVMTRERGWMAYAACATAPASELSWITETHSGIETPSTSWPFDLCTTCPARRPCLREALGEIGFAVEGVWGGTTRTERTRTRQEVARDLSVPVAGAGRFLGRAIVEEVARRLERSFIQRVVCWRALEAQRRSELQAQREARRAHAVT